MKKQAALAALQSDQTGRDEKEKLISKDYWIIPE